METSLVGVKSETRNHKGFFVQHASYKLMGVDQSGWALICIDDTTCHYVDPDNLRRGRTDAELSDPLT
jgi:hypothetical protein